MCICVASVCSGLLYEKTKKADAVIDFMKRRKPSCASMALLSSRVVKGFPSSLALASLLLSRVNNTCRKQVHRSPGIAKKDEEGKNGLSATSTVAPRKQEIAAPPGASALDQLNLRTKHRTTSLVSVKFRGSLER